MAMSVRPNEDGGRAITLDTPYLLFRADISEDGSLRVLEQEIRTPPPGPPKPPPPPAGPGDRFHDLIVAHYGVRPCARCLEIMGRMNRLGVDGCRREREAILDEIWERRDQLEGWRAIAAKLPGARRAAKRELGRLFDQAMG